jgi:hypothetical protein
MSTRQYLLRDSILDELNKVYAIDLAGKEWYQVKHNSGNSRFSGEQNIQLTTDLLALFVYHTISELDTAVEDSFYADARNLIWNSYAGGGTADIVAKRICKILHLDVDKDEY